MKKYYTIQTDPYKVNKLLTYAIMLALLILEQVQFVISLMELKKMLNQELKYLYSKTATVLSD
jgi:hypothetical protein